MTQTHHAPIIGLTGGIGSGKSTVAKIFQSLGIQTIDADDVAREVVQPGSPCLAKIAEHFGTDILLDDGQLNRRALRDIIFKDEAQRLWLESLTHPIIRQRLTQYLENATSAYVILVHPLLFETRQDQICQLTVAIDTSKESQIGRITQRDNTSPEQAERIINTQLSNRERLISSDLSLKNDSNLMDLNDRVRMLHKSILERLNARD